MARPRRPWLRWYVEAVHDRKLRKRPPAQRWLWVAMLSASRESPTPGLLLDELGDPMTEADIADYAAVPRRDVAQALPVFERVEMITREGEAWRIVNWGHRQFETDDVTARTRRHRSKEPDGNVPTNVPSPFLGTSDDSSEERSPSRAPATETETETDPLPSSSDSRGADLGPDGGGEPDIVDQALRLAAQRYGEHQVDRGNGRDVNGLTRYWMQENATGARTRASQLLAEYDLTPVQLADALGSVTAPRWLAHHRRRPTSPEPEPATTSSKVVSIARDRLQHPNAQETSTDA